MCKSDMTEELLLAHCRTYPELEIQDLFKFLYQSSFGCEHLLSEPAMVIDYIKQEAEKCKTCFNDVIENLDGDYCRVHLDYLRMGLSAATLGKLFCLSAKKVENGIEKLEKKLFVLMSLAKEGKISFEEDKLQQAIETWRQEGYTACCHSQHFHNMYAPSYRVIAKEYAFYLPLFAKIDRLMQQKNVVFAIDGGCGSGKTTLSNLLKEVYECNVFHMDDFFLQFHQRTKERLAEPGGNVDRERFFEEVLVPLHKNEVVNYRPFDCGSLTILSGEKIVPKRLNIIEGSYSMHPKFDGMYDFGVFLDVEPKLQKERILIRNSPEFARRFFEQWIPMEEQYHTAMDVRRRCELYFKIE